MDASKIALRTLARLTPQAAEKRLMEYFLDFNQRWCADIIARPDIYRAAIREGLPTLPPDQREYLELVWNDLEIRLARGFRELFKNPTGEEAGLEAHPPESGRGWVDVFIAPLFCEPDEDEGLLQLQITAGWCTAHPPHVDLIDIGQRLNELAAIYG